MLKSILVLIIFISAMTIIGGIMPQALTDKINSAFVYFLSQINNLRPISATIISNIFDIIYLLGNYLVLVGSFFAVRWILNLIS